MKTKIITILFLIFLLLSINAWFFKCQAMTRDDYNKLHYLTHFTAHQGLTNIFHVSNFKAASICFAAGFGNEIFDEMSYCGLIDKKGLFFDPYMGFEWSDIYRNCIGIGCSIFINEFVIPEKFKNTINFKIYRGRFNELGFKVYFIIK